MLTLFLLLLVPISSVATEKMPTIEELVQFTKEAEYCGTHFWGAGVFNFFSSSTGLLLDSPNTAWARKEGLVPETFEKTSAGELYGTNGHSGNAVQLEKDIFENTPEAAYPKGVTIESLKSLYYRYFAYDFAGVFACTVRREHDTEKCHLDIFLKDSDGRLYCTPGEYTDDSMTADVMGPDEIFWASARITEQSKNKIQMTLYGVNPDEYFWTVEFMKTANGWRISGGTYFPPAVQSYPETGDNTPVFVALIALPALGLSVLAVKKGKKRRREENKFKE